MKQRPPAVLKTIEKGIAQVQQQSRDLWAHCDAAHCEAECRHIVHTAQMIQQALFRAYVQNKPYLEKDFKNLKHYWQAGRQYVQDRIAYDFGLLEESLMYYSNMALDKARLDWYLFPKRLRMGPVYHVGDRGVAGQLQCDQCGLSFRSVRSRRLRPCKNCAGDEFFLAQPEKKQQKK